MQIETRQKEARILKGYTHCLEQEFAHIPYMPSSLALAKAAFSRLAICEHRAAFP